MKILIIHNHYQQPGGEKIAVEAQHALLEAHGHQVILYSKNSAEIDHYDFWQKAAFFPRTIYSGVTYAEIRTLIAKEQPHIAHLHNVLPLISPAVYRALKQAGVPTVQTVHNFRFMCPNGLFYIRGQICERCKHGNTLHAVRRKCYRESYLLSALYALAIGLHRRWGTFQAIDRFVALTRFTAQKLLESGLATPDKISVLGNFLPDPLPTPGAFEKREPYFVFLGRISPEKGLEILLEAMAGLPHLRLKILGNGPQAQALQILSRERKLHQVEFLGHVTGVKKWELLQRAWATVVPSICYEGFPLAALESLAVGTPVVAARHGSLPWVIENGKSGLLFKPGVAKDLRAKLAWLANNREPALAMGQYARQVAKSRFTAAAHYNGLMRIYQELLS